MSCACSSGFSTLKAAPQRFAPSPQALGSSGSAACASAPPKTAHPLPGLVALHAGQQPAGHGLIFQHRQC